jgi:hypothetical protein
LRGRGTLVFGVPTTNPQQKKKKKVVMASQSMLRNGLANLSFSKPAVSVNMPDDELMAEDWDDIRRGDHVPHIVFYKFKTFFRKKNPDGWVSSENFGCM